jgi:hypothetical protein
MLPRLRPDRLARELLVRAAKIRGTSIKEAPTAVDATAGLGEDALLLATAGFEVTLVERDSTIFALLADALDRAERVDTLAGPVARMHLVQGDGLQVLASLPEPPDVVYLDPMFPARRKSAAVKKKFQLLHQLEAPCADQEYLLGNAKEIAALDQGGNPITYLLANGMGGKVGIGFLVIAVLYIGCFIYTYVKYRRGTLFREDAADQDGVDEAEAVSS